MFWSLPTPDTLGWSASSCHSWSSTRQLLLCRGAQGFITLPAPCWCHWSLEHCCPPWSVDVGVTLSLLLCSSLTAWPGSSFSSCPGSSVPSLSPAPSSRCSLFLPSILTSSSSLLLSPSSGAGAASAFHLVRKHTNISWKTNITDVYIFRYSTEFPT